MSITSLARRLPRPRLSYANIASTAALVLALGTGTAYAADTIFSTDIVDGEVKNADLAVNAVNTGKILNGGVWAQDIKPGDLTGDQVADGSLNGADLAPAAIGNAQLADNSVGGLQLQDGSVGTAEIATDGVGATEVQDDSIDGGELVNDSIGSSDLASGSVGASEVVDGALTGADIANDGLTMSDLAGGGTTNGHVSFSGVANGRCAEVTVGISGATAGDAVVITTKADMPNGIFLYGTEVVSSSSARAVICNMSGGVMPAITDMPVRIHTFH